MASVQNGKAAAKVRGGKPVQVEAGQGEESPAPSLADRQREIGERLRWLTGQLAECLEESDESRVLSVYVQRSKSGHVSGEFLFPGEITVLVDYGGLVIG